jgi:hypothetical protein
MICVIVAIIATILFIENNFEDFYPKGACFKDYSQIDGIFRLDIAENFEEIIDGSECKKGGDFPSHEFIYYCTNISHPSYYDDGSYRMGFIH